MTLGHVRLLDGPCQGKPVQYGHPLPTILVIADQRGPVRWHDYEQVAGRAEEYRHSRRCPCLGRYEPVQLDLSGPTNVSGISHGSGPWGYHGIAALLESGEPDEAEQAREAP